MSISRINRLCRRVVVVIFSVGTNGKLVTDPLPVTKFTGEAKLASGLLPERPPARTFVQALAPHLATLHQTAPHKFGLHKAGLWDEQKGLPQLHRFPHLTKRLPELGIRWNDEWTGANPS